MNVRAVKILVVDDDAFVRDMLVAILEGSGYLVTTAENGAKAYESFCADRCIDLIITDMDMPEMNGLELISTLQKTEADVPVIILTGGHEISVAIKAMSSGASDYLLKDENVEDTILISVEQVLEKKEIEKKNIQLMTDIAEKNIELERTNQELVALNQLKNKFLGIAAHDLRNPLGIIEAFSELLMEEIEDSLDEDQKEYLDTIKNKSGEMLDLVNDLLDVSVIESGKLNLKLTRGSIKILIENRIKENRVMPEKKEIAILSSFDDVPDVLFDANRVSQVFDNLMSNAIKFSPHGSKIYVTMYKKDQMIAVDVKDEGPGIPEEERSLLFGEFQQLSSQPTGGEKSTGLGLAIVKKTIEAHQGTITVKSEIGKGSTFTFAVPIEVKTE